MCTYVRAQHLCGWRTTCRCQFLSFHHLDWTQVIRIDNKHLYPFLWPQDSLFRLPSSSQNWSMPASSTAYRQDPRTQFKTIRLKHLGLCVLRNAKENLWVLETQFSVNSSHCMMSPRGSRVVPSVPTNISTTMGVLILTPGNLKEAQNFRFYAQNALWKTSIYFSK